MLDRAGVDRLDEELAVLGVLQAQARQLRSTLPRRATHLLKLPIESLDQLLLQEPDDLFDVPRRNHLERNREGLPPHLHVGTSEDAEDVHDEFVEDVLVLGVKEGDALEDDHLDVVGGFLENEGNEAACGGWGERG